MLIQNNDHCSLETLKFRSNIRNIIALVFYGRKASVSILLKYLEKNLKSNGGILDKIVFAVRTKKPGDLKYLEEYLKLKIGNEYERHDFNNEHDRKYKEPYRNLHENDLVFKIDDDIVFISNDTFESMVEEYLKNNAVILSANVINHPILTHVHSKLGVILPFIDIKNYKFVITDNLTENDKSIGLTNGKIKTNDSIIGAITHESFFVHYKNGNLKKYDFGLWDFHKYSYSRWSINFILFKGKYAKYVYCKDFSHLSDEQIISIKIPIKLKKHAYALRSALVSHFSYRNQYKYLSKTDILKKYDILI